MKHRFQSKLKRYGTIRLRFAFLALICSAGIWPQFTTRALECPDVKIVFARGSGGERWRDKNYLEFRETIEKKLKTVSLSYEFIDLDYPAVGVGMDNLGVTLGAFFGGGEAYEFGRSVKTGVNNLTNLVNDEPCKNTKFVLGGYSQGAMVVSKALPSLNESKIIYAATFGDPKLYLPEGAGLVPIACGGRGLSDYRMYVPDCQAHKGLLGAYIPYRPESLKGRVGTWCNKKDIFCSSKFNMSDHTAYVADELYQDASKVIFDKICREFGLKNQISSPHDTVIMLDSSGSMAYLYKNYKEEAIRLANETFRIGGRVALYDYRDLKENYQPIEHCNFETCTPEIFEEAINSITLEGGGDEKESLLSAAFTAMKSLKWRFGATKSMVVITDAPFLLPDRDGITLDDVVSLSKKIDPVNFYIVTKDRNYDSYVELAERTDGKIVTDYGELSLLTDYILERYDSLPRVEEEYFGELPTLEVLSATKNEAGEAKVRFRSSNERTMVILNDAILGITNEPEIVINGILNDTDELVLVPLTDELRGEGVLVSFDSWQGWGEVNVSKNSDRLENYTTSGVLIPKAPNTGRR